MKVRYDIVVIGKSVAGSFFTLKSAEKGLNVLMISGPDCDKTGFDVIRLRKSDITAHALPLPEAGDGVFCFEYADNFNYSVYGKHPKYNQIPVIGVHSGNYSDMINSKAEQAGADVEYTAVFSEFLYSCERICGVKVIAGGEEKEIKCSLAVDCSAQSSAVTTKLPDYYGIEKVDEETLFVKRRFIKFKEKQPRWHKCDGFIRFGTLVYPGNEESDAVIETASSVSYADSDILFDGFKGCSKLPDYEIINEESAEALCHKPIPAFTADGFLTLGEYANPGTGIAEDRFTLADIAADTACSVIASGRYPAKELLWNINKDYALKYGADKQACYEMSDAINKCGSKANEYLFAKDILFTEKYFGETKFDFGTFALIKIAVLLIIGMITGNISQSEFKTIYAGFKAAKESFKAHKDYPAHPGFYKEWVKEQQKSDM